MSSMTASPATQTAAPQSTSARSTTAQSTIVQPTAAQHSSAPFHARFDTSSTGAHPHSHRGSRLRRRLPDRVAFYLQASIVVSFLAASSAPTPLYAAYQAAWHFSPITTTVVFGVYAVAVLAALLTVGSLSDHIGRRPILITAIALQAASMLVFSTAGSVTALMAARVIQGVATGAALGAVGAGMLDLDKAKGTITNAVAPMTGTATGALLSGALVQYLPAPEHLVYFILFGIFVLQALGVARMRETSAPRDRRARLAAPATRRPAGRARPPAQGPAGPGRRLGARWLYGSVGPAVVGLVTGSHSPVLGGLALFVLAGSAAVTVFLLRDARPRTVMLYGTAMLMVGVGITLLGIEARSAPVFFVGAVIAGSGFGGGFQGAIRTVVPLAAPHERSGLLSTVYIVCYLGMGLPAVAGGALVVHGGLLPAAREYGVAVIVLAATALIAVARPVRAVRPAPGA